MKTAAEEILLELADQTFRKALLKLAQDTTTTPEDIVAFGQIAMIMFKLAKEEKNNT